MSGAVDTGPFADALVGLLTGADVRPFAGLLAASGDGTDLLRLLGSVGAPADDDARRALAACRARVAAGETATATVELSGVDGARTVELAVRPRAGEHGGLAVEGILRDVTAEVAAQRSLAAVGGDLAALLGATSARVLRWSIGPAGDASCLADRGVLALGALDGGPITPEGLARTLQPVDAGAVRGLVGEVVAAQRSGRPALRSLDVALASGGTLRITIRGRELAGERTIVDAVLIDRTGEQRDRDRADAALVRQAAAAAAGVLLATVELDGEPAERLLGRGVAAGPLARLEAAVPEDDDAAAALARFWSELRDGVPANVTARFRLPAGASAWLALHGIPQARAGTAAVAILDVTEAERARRAAEEARRLASVLLASTDYWLLSSRLPDGRGPARPLLDLRGGPADHPLRDVVATIEDLIARIHPDDLERFGAVWSPLVERARSGEHAAATLDLRLVDDAGEARHVRGRFDLDRGHDGVVVHAALADVAAETSARADAAARARQLADVAAATGLGIVIARHAADGREARAELIANRDVLEAAVGAAAGDGELLHAWLAARHPEDAAGVERQVAALVARGGGEDTATVRRGPRVAEERFSVRTDGDELVVTTSIRDVTAERDRDQTQRRQLADQTEVLDVFRRVTATFGEAVFTVEVNPDGSWSPLPGWNLGVLADVLGGEPASDPIVLAETWKAATNPLDRKENERRLRALYRGDRDDLRLDYRVTDVHGREHHMHDRGIARRRDGRVLLDGVVRCVDVQRALEGMRRDATRQLEHAMEQVARITRVTTDYLWSGTVRTDGAVMIEWELNTGLVSELVDLASISRAPDFRATIVPEHRPAHDAFWQRMAAEGEGTHQLRFAAVDRSGVRRWLGERIRVERVGDTVRATGAMRQIDELVDAETARRELADQLAAQGSFLDAVARAAEAHLYTIFLTSDGGWRLARSLNVDWFYDLIDSDRAHVLADPAGAWYAGMHPDDRQACRDAMERVAQGDLAAGSYEFRARAVDGREVWLLDSYRPERLADGRIAIHGALRSIDPLRRALEERAELRRTLARTLAIGDAFVLARTVSETSDAVRYLPGRTALARITGGGGADVESFAAFLELIHPDDRDGLAAHQRSLALAGAAGVVAPAEYEVRLLGTDGVHRYRLRTLTRLLPDGGVELFTVGLDARPAAATERELEATDRLVAQVLRACAAAVWIAERPAGATLWDVTGLSGDIEDTLGIDASARQVDLGERWTRRATAAEAPVVRAAWTRAARGEEVVFECSHVRAGVMRVLSTRVMPELVGDGTLRAVCVTEDATERRLLEEDVRRLRDR